MFKKIDNKNYKIPLAKKSSWKTQPVTKIQKKTVTTNTKIQNQFTTKTDETQKTKRSMVKNFKRHIQFTLNAENTNSNSNSNFKSQAIKIF